MANVVKKTFYFDERDDGSIVFTDQGRRELKPLFAKLGVDIEDVKTKAEADKLIDQSVAESLADEEE